MSEEAQPYTASEVAENDAKAAAPPDLMAAALGLARDALVQVHPDAVPELIQGATPDELRASVDAAKAAGAALVGRLRVAAPVVEAVPAGAPVRQAAQVDPATLSATGKIAHAIAQQANALRRS